MIPALVSESIAVCVWWFVHSEGSTQRSDQARFTQMTQIERQFGWVAGVDYRVVLANGNWNVHGRPRAVADKIVKQLFHILRDRGGGVFIGKVVHLIEGDKQWCSGRFPVLPGRCSQPKV